MFGLKDMPKMLLLTHVRGLEMSNQFMLSDDVLDTLPTKLRAYYKLWLMGEDLRIDLPKRTYYRIRKELKNMILILLWCVTLISQLTMLFH